MSNPRRHAKLERELQRTVANEILFGLNDPRAALTITITRVELARDGLTAAVFYGVIGDETKRRAADRLLTHARGRIQTAVAKAIDIRQHPKLEFVYDQAIEGTIRVQAMLDELAEEPPVPQGHATAENDPELADVVGTPGDEGEADQDDGGDEPESNDA